MTLTGDKEKSLQTGMNYFLTKPINAASLNAQILAAVNKTPEAPSDAAQIED
jgi:CheY-like chemotaxis protein